jgi:DNA mismatch repair protein MutS
MGGRKLRQWMLEPLAEKEAIEGRLSAVEELLFREEVRRRLRSHLQKVHDVERLLSRILGRVGGPREMWLLGSSLVALGDLSREMRGLESPLLKRIAERVDGVPALSGEIERALVPDPSPGGGFIRPGYRPEIDLLRERLSGDRSWIRELEARERERTGIRSLKIGYNRVFGYYIEVTNPNRHLVPPHYERKQTMAGAERYVIPELKEREVAIAASEEELARLEEETLAELRQRVEERREEIREQADRVAELDVICSLAEAARRYGYTRPVIEESRVLEMKEGRHPVLERALGPGGYVPNDVYMDESRHFLLLTGPNMAGKSSLARQVALAVVMAQMGSFVPAAYFRLGIVDRIFTRIGSADDLWGGRSTFMVEMAEVAEILRSATERSLVLLDEVGRGTGTADGLSIAWAVAEYLHDRIRARTIFATHFHELTALENSLPRLQNLTMAVAEKDGQIRFLYRIRPGKSSRSFGLYVAALAGLPEEVLSRASQLSREMEQNGLRRPRSSHRSPDQLPLLAPWVG